MADRRVDSFLSLRPDICAELKQRYAEPWRHYHTWQHIESLLGNWEKYHQDLRSPLTVELAILYHDAVYNPEASDNEFQSAALLRQELAGLVPAQIISDAGSMIEATAGHKLPTDGTPDYRADCAMFLDMDIAILGAQEDEFGRYENQIRAEYAHVPDDLFAAGRAAIL